MAHFFVRQRHPINDLWFEVLFKNDHSIVVDVKTQLTEDEAVALAHDLNKALGVEE